MGTNIMIGNRIVSGRRTGSHYSGPVPLVHYDFSKYSNEDFINNPDKLVKDLTGNGYDLKLYNFAFAGMSGFGGYTADMSKLNLHYDTAVLEVVDNSLKCTEVLKKTSSPIAEWPLNKIASGPITVRFRVTGVSDNRGIRFESYAIEDGMKTLFIATEDGVYTAEISDPNKYYRFIADFSDDNVYPINCNITIEQLPLYPGGLVSDGVDDYGQCISQFALPDDYTIVAVRKRLVNNGYVASKATGNTDGAFIFEGGADTFSYGRVNNPLPGKPSLFSYQSKNSYNGTAISSGTGSDTEQFVLLRNYINGSLYLKAVLYDLRIYDHSLSDKELQTVKDEMMADYEKHAKPLDGIHYVCDFDAKGRSNDEEEPMRSTWTDRATGKVIDLHNYAFAAGSGWNGYAQDWNSYSDINPRYITRTPAKIEIIETITPLITGISFINATDIGSYSIKVSGMKSGDNIYYYHYPSPESTKRKTLHITEDGTYVLPATYTPTGTVMDNPYVGFWGNVSEGVTIEQLPLYPGALVSDGVDDYGQTQEAINERIGTVLIHCEKLSDSTKWRYYSDGVVQSRIYIAYTPGHTFFTNLKVAYKDNNMCIGIANNSPQGNDKLYIASNNKSAEKGNVAIYRFIIIQEQLDDAQVEFLRWKVEKEYRDWCKANGYEYAINQLTA